MSDSSYTDLAQRIEESFAEIEDEAIADFKKNGRNLCESVSTDFKAESRQSVYW